MKIIVGTDFSKNARAAGTAAAALVRRWNGTLLVAHVFDDLVSGRLPSDIRETLAASTNDRLHDEAVHLGSEGLKVEEHMLSGAPEKEFEPHEVGNMSLIYPLPPTQLPPELKGVEWPPKT